MDISTGHPAAIQPKDIEVAIISHQFIHLVIGKFLVIFPPVRMTVYLIILAAVGELQNKDSKTIQQCQSGLEK